MYDLCFCRRFHRRVPRAPLHIANDLSVKQRRVRTGIPNASRMSASERRAIPRSLSISMAVGYRGQCRKMRFSKAAPITVSGSGVRCAYGDNPFLYVLYLEISSKVYEADEDIRRFFSHILYETGFIKRGTFYGTLHPCPTQKHISRRPHGSHSHKGHAWGQPSACWLVPHNNSRAMCQW